MRKNAFSNGIIKKDKETFDSRLKEAMSKIQTDLPKEYDLLHGYLLSLVYMEAIDANAEKANEVAAIKYHQQSVIMKLIKKLFGTKEI